MAAVAPSAAGPQQNANQAAGRAQPLIPFPQASRRARETPLSWTFTPGASPITLGPADLTPNGFLRYVTIEVLTAVAGTLGPGVVGGDWPFSLFQNLQFLDTGGQKMDDLPGFALLQDNIVGGLRAVSDPRLDYDYSANPISPHFRLRLERELFPDGRGALPNLSGSQKYRIRLVIDAIANQYTTAPTTAPTLQINIIDQLWLLPAAVDGGQRPQARRPPLLGLAQYRTSWYPSIAVSSSQVNIQVKATGNLIKYYALIGRLSTGVRSDLLFPDPFTMRVDNSYPYDNVPLAEVIAEAQNMIPGTSQRDTGVLLLPKNWGLGRRVGDEGVSSLEPTSTATYLQIKGVQPTPTVGAIDILVCEVSTAEIDPSERASLGSGTGTWQPAIAGDVTGGV